MEMQDSSSAPTKSQVLFVIEDRVLMVIQGNYRPTDESHSAFLQFMRDHGHEYDAMLVYSPGGTPDMVQRKKLVAVLKLRRRPISVLTDSKIVRGVVTAVSWFVETPLKSFALADIDAAVSFIGQSANAERVRRAMHAQIDHGATDV